MRDDGSDAANGITLPADAAVALIVTLELPPGTRAAQAFEEIGQARDRNAPDTPLIRFCAMLSDAGVLDDVAIAVPGDRERAAQLMAAREAVPASVNQRVGRAKQADGLIEKTAGDMIVPFQRSAACSRFVRRSFARADSTPPSGGTFRTATSTPISSPARSPTSNQDRAPCSGIGREAIRPGGAPLAEHGVGRNPVKQRLLREMYGETGIDAMRRVKDALDPDWKLAPGVLFRR